MMLTQFVTERQSNFKYFENIASQTPVGNLTKS